MNLVIDLGNSYGKMAVCDGLRVLESGVYEKITKREVSYFHTRYREVKGVIVSSVVNDSRELIDYLGNLYDRCIELNHSTPIPLANNYLTPETLGFDRIAAAVGAFTLYPDMNILVIDAGTTVTYDIVTREGEYVGGNISPGLDIRFKSLNRFTSRIPLLEKPVDAPPPMGRTTMEAVQSGVVNGLIHEMEGFISSISNNYPELKVVLTGGDANYFAGRLKSSIFVNLDLNLLGLNRILEHNAAET